MIGFLTFLGLAAFCLRFHYAFDDKAAVRDYFTRLTGLFKNFNYAASDSPEYQRLLQDIDALAESTP